MPRVKDDTLTCLRCKLPIFGVELKFAVCLANGHMHATCHRENWEIVFRLRDEAIAAGTHSTSVSTWCDFCRRMREGGSYHGTFDRKSACFECAVKLGLVKLPEVLCPTR